MKMTTKLVDRWNDPEPCERYSEYEVLADGEPTGYSVRRVGTDVPELIDPNGNDEYLASDDLRSGLAEARRVVASRIS